MRSTNNTQRLPKLEHRLTKSGSLTNLTSTPKRSLSKQRSASMPQLSAELVVSNATSIIYECCKSDSLASTDGHTHLVDVVSAHASESFVQSLVLCVWRMLLHFT
jgi:hypothetical protein